MCPISQVSRKDWASLGKLSFIIRKDTFSIQDINFKRVPCLWSTVDRPATCWRKMRLNCRHQHLNFNLLTPHYLVCVCVCVCVVRACACCHVWLFVTSWTSLLGSSPWNFPGKSTGMGCHFLLQGIFLTQGSNPGFLCLLLWQAGSLPTVPLGSCTWEAVSWPFKKSGLDYLIEGQGFR